MHAIDAAVTPACTGLAAYVTRTSGIFATTAASQTLSFDVWPSKAAFDAAPNGEKKCFILATDGAGSPGPTWFTPESLCFVKTC